MRILVLSDSHGSEQAVLKAHTSAGDVDAIIHLGDGEADCLILEQLYNIEVIRVAGNCDLASTKSRELILEFDGMRLLLAHGDRYGVKTGLTKLEQRGVEAGADVVLYGHSHLALIEQRPPLLLVNPGTLWHSAPFRSYAILELNNKQDIQATIYPLVS
jgi:uncharacterized protein